MASFLSFMLGRSSSAQKMRNVFAHLKQGLKYLKACSPAAAADPAKVGLGLQTAERAVRPIRNGTVLGTVPSTVQYGTRTGPALAMTWSHRLRADGTA